MKHEIKEDTKLEDLNLDIRGQIHLTPAISMSMEFNIRDVEPILRKKAREANVELYVHYEIVQDGVLITWGPSEDLESTDGLKMFK